MNEAQQFKLFLRQHLRFSPRKTRLKQTMNVRYTFHMCSASPNSGDVTLDIPNP